MLDLLCTIMDILLSKNNKNGIENHNTPDIKLQPQMNFTEI